MNRKPETVFVLGAGFTKAFLPDAPLLLDNYGIEEVIGKYRTFDNITKILQAEKERRDDDRIDIERLLTRLEGLPFDTEETLIHFASVKRDVHRLFLDRLEEAKKEGIKYQEELKDFAYYCLVHQLTCVTFNYDDVLDQALHEVSKTIEPAPAIYWHPNSGYGFYIPPSAECIREPFWPNNERSAMLIHKLHGSTNWRTKLGFSRPYPIDAIVHHENWSSFKEQPLSSRQFLEPHLTDDVFIIPPVLVKTALQEPIVKKIWVHAYRTLSEAERVIFIGYSCPVTDLAANFLFSQTLSPKRDKVTVVDREKVDAQEQQEFKERYRQIIPMLHDDQFHFTGARKWLHRFLTVSRGVLSGSQGQKAAKHVLEFLDGETEPSYSSQRLCSKIGAADPNTYEQVIQKLIDDEIIIRDASGNVLLWRRPEDPKFRRLDSFDSESDSQ